MRNWSNFGGNRKLAEAEGRDDSMPIKILLVDDSASDRLIIKNLLSEYEVLTACDGLEAMRILNEHEGINLLILDLNMPNMNGFEVLEAIKKDERFSKLRTIILTVYDELDNEIRGLKLGAVDYIRKPIQMDSLKARIDVHIRLLRAEYALQQQLEEKTFTFDLIFNQAPIGIAIVYGSAHSDKPVVIVNPLFEKIVGRTREELMQVGWDKITHPDDLEEDLKNFKRLQSGEINMYSMDKRYIKPDGSIVWVHMIVAPLNFLDDRHFNHICLVQDITERKVVKEALHESERSKSVFLSHLPGLAYRCNYDREWTMQYVSNGCYNLTGYPPESLLYNRDLSYNDIISPEYRETLWEKWKHILAEKKPFKHEYEIITATGEKKWVLEMGQGVYNEKGEVEALEGIVLDISDRKAFEDALKYSNEHDVSTGLYNREYLVSLLEKDIKLKKNVKKALIGINLSAAQILTTKYGFPYTLNLIKKVAEALNRLCTDNRLLFHVREYRFVFYVVNYKDKNEIVDFSNDIIKTLETLFVTDRISGGIEILEIGPDQVDIDLLLRRLLIASERSISLDGKNYVICFYDEVLEALVNRERDIEEALNRIAADEKTDDELFLQFQPILDIKTNKIRGFEALARLRTEKFGLVPPLEFIQIAEKTKLILPIGEKVIIKAFQFLNSMKERGYDEVGVSINISAIQLLNPGFTDRLFEIINEMRINPRNVCIEITESIFTSDFDKVNNIIKKLKNAGLHIAIDDFGTGYSSLSRVNELSVNCIKIDKYFIDSLLHTDLNEAITSDIVSMAHKLGHCTIAEGVECENQLEYLKRHDCDKVQGYFISRPLLEDDAIKFLERHSGGIL